VIAAQAIPTFAWSFALIPAGLAALIWSPLIVSGCNDLDRRLAARLLGPPWERDVLALMAEGRSNSAIAAILVVSERAVEKHVSNIFSKFGLAPSDADHRRVLAVLRYLEA
jgi:DNA-binding NarL/FixJ family response regulator